MLGFLSSSRWVRVGLATFLLVCLIGFLSWLRARYSVPSIPAIAYRRPISVFEQGKLVIRIPHTALVGELAHFQDELFAYLIFDYMRSRPRLAGEEFLLTYAFREKTIRYTLRVVLQNDLSASANSLTGLANNYPFLAANWQAVDERVLAEQRAQTQNFVLAYNFPAYVKLEHLSTKEVVAYTRRFIRMKSNTDPRIRRSIEPIPHALNSAEAQKLAEDIVTIAEFYELPLDFFLGIGAMENNYMNVKGDLGHAVWKKRAGKDDIILRRSARGVLVLNESSGVWQITRETLRYVHSLYLRDSRDYGKLPEHLRPPRVLDLNGLEHQVLTTYAGLLFRDLLDRFPGNPGKAIGAYNGGPGNPNAKYEAGVRTAAENARRVLEQAAVLRGKRVVDMQFLRSGSTP